MPLPGFENIDGLTQRAKDASADLLAWLQGGGLFSSNTLEVRFGLSGPEIRAIIASLRLEGHPICSDTRGYHYAKSGHDLDTTIDHLRARRYKIDLVTAALNSTREKMLREEFRGDGQTALF